jgi:hypothetical protein
LSAVCGDVGEEGCYDAVEGICFPFDVESEKTMEAGLWASIRVVLPTEDMKSTELGERKKTLSREGAEAR